jgi:ring-1,2-phenylacetyl-CoA epoxidase subunit PaaC
MPGGAAAILDPKIGAAFREWVLRAADDELVIGHRHSEWTGVGPDIESDVALSSIAQEEIGHARAFYEQIVRNAGQDVDHLAFARAPADYRHAVFVERENGGWEWSIIRLVLYERYDAGRLRLLAASGVEPAAGLARTLAREERYHALFAEAWLTRLVKNTTEGHRRMQAALDAAWPEALALFEATDADDTLLANGILPATSDAERAAWEGSVRPLLERCGLAVPAVPASLGGRRGRHTQEFARLHAQMTEVWRTDPEARW